MPMIAAGSLCCTRLPKAGALLEPCKEVLQHMFQSQSSIWLWSEFAALCNRLAQLNSLLNRLSGANAAVDMKGIFRRWTSAAVLALGPLGVAGETDSQCAMQLGAKTASKSSAGVAAGTEMWTFEDIFGSSATPAPEEIGSHLDSGLALAEADATPVKSPGKAAAAAAKLPVHSTASKASKATASKATKGEGSNQTDYVAAMIQNFLQKPLPPKNEAVSETRPLVFMHQHRAGGTTLRKLLYNTSLSLKMKPHIQCSGGVDCRAFKNQVTDASVYGGQFCWREMMTSLSGKQVSCLTNFREPVARITSCYMQRLVEKKKVAPFCMAKLDPKKLKTLLVNYGCVNEPFRRLGQCGVQTHADANDKKARMQIWNNTLENLASCVPILVDKQDTYSAAVKHFPQFKQVFWQMKKEKLNTNSYPKDCEIPASHMAVIQELAGEEKLLYEAAKKRALAIHAHSS